MSQAKVTKKAIENIFSGILSGVSKETKETYPRLIEMLGKLKDADDFYMTFMYPVENCLDEAIIKRIDFAKVKDVNDSKSKLGFIYRNHGFIENHLTKLIVSLEGSACSADKSRYIIKAYEKYFFAGVPLGLPRSKKDDKKGCYWKPKFWNDKKWLEYLGTLVSLYYGEFKPYVVFIKENYLPLLTKGKNE